MKNDRQWLENYRVNPRGDKTLYKNYYNPNQSGIAPIQQEQQQAGLMKALPQGFSQAQEQMLMKLPQEMQNMNLEDILKKLSEDFSKENMVDYNANHDIMFNQAKANYEQNIQKENNLFAQKQQAAEQARQLEEQKRIQLQEQLRQQQAYKPPVQPYKPPVPIQRKPRYQYFIAPNTPIEYKNISTGNGAMSTFVMPFGEFESTYGLNHSYMKSEAAQNHGRWFDHNDQKYYNTQF